MELLTWMRENLGMQSKRASAPTRTASPGESQGPDADAPPDELKVRRERQPAGELLARAEELFPSGMNTARGKPASLRDIQEALTIGQGKAQQVQAHFKALQAAAAG
jgi:hypothetical protein